MAKLTVMVVTDCKDESQIVISGGRQDNPTLDEYLDELTDEWKERMTVLAEFIKSSIYYNSSIKWLF